MLPIQSTLVCLPIFFLCGAVCSAILSTGHDRLILLLSASSAMPVSGFLFLLIRPVVGAIPDVRICSILLLPLLPASFAARLFAHPLSWAAILIFLYAIGLLMLRGAFSQYVLHSMVCWRCGYPCSGEMDLNCPECGQHEPASRTTRPSFYFIPADINETRVQLWACVCIAYFVIVVGVGAMT